MTSTIVQQLGRIKRDEKLFRWFCFLILMFTAIIVTPIGVKLFGFGMPTFWNRALLMLLVIIIYGIGWGSMFYCERKRLEEKIRNEGGVGKMQSIQREKLEESKLHEKLWLYLLSLLFVAFWILLVPIGIEQHGFGTLKFWVQTSMLPTIVVVLGIFVFISYRSEQKEIEKEIEREGGVQDGL